MNIVIPSMNKKKTYNNLNATMEILTGTRNDAIGMQAINAF